PPRGSRRAYGDRARPAGATGDHGDGPRSAGTRPEVIVPDSGVLIAALASYHAAHERAIDAVGNAPRLIVHVAFETCSVLSRMPEDRRMEPAVVLDALEREFPEPWL